MGGLIGSMDVSIPVAFGAGFLSFFSPCILPLIPVYIMYLTGTSAESEIHKRKILAITRTFGFILGFTFIFMLMGLSASFLGRIFIRNRLLFLRISGLVMILFGLNLFGLFKLKFFKFPTLIKRPDKITSFFGAMIMGLAFGAGWTPCFGPVLAPIVFYAGASSTASYGMMLLMVYSLGMAIPFMLTAIFINGFNHLLTKTERLMKYIPKISGLILIMFGLLILFNKLVFLNSLFF